MLFKSEKEKCFAYSFHTACDRNGFILGLEVTAANVHDSIMFESVLDQVKRNVGKPKFVGVDAGYKIPYICKSLLEQGIEPAMPYKRPMTKNGFMKKYEYAYDEYYDCYICPNNHILSYSTTNREGYREYKSKSYICANCTLRSNCTGSKDTTKQITRHVWEKYIEEVDHLRHSYSNKEIYARRKETIERVFADMKEKHGMRWTTLRGKEKVSAQAMLIAACMNLKKLANWRWKSPKFGPNGLCFESNNYYFIFINKKTLLNAYAKLKVSFVYKLRLMTSSSAFYFIWLFLSRSLGLHGFHFF